MEIHIYFEKLMLLRCVLCRRVRHSVAVRVLRRWLRPRRRVTVSMRNTWSPHLVRILLINQSIKWNLY